MSLLIDDIKTELHFVGRYWRLSGRPTVCILIREEHMRFNSIIHFRRILSNICIYYAEIRNLKKCLSC